MLYVSLTSANNCSRKEYPNNISKDIGKHNVHTLAHQYCCSQLHLLLLSNNNVVVIFFPTGFSFVPLSAEKLHISAYQSKV